jgi:formylglycine-generating enzyme required for sulfatase activity
LHGAGVLHRDLKPANILVDKNGNGWLTDFGLARLHRPGAAQRAAPATGTVGFMSPEQWDGGEEVDARTDVFAMGVTLYEAFTLELPYGKDRIATATPPARLPKAQRRSLPPNLDLVLLRAVHPDRQSRYQSAADLRDDWQRVRKGHLPQKAPVGPGRRLLHVARRRTGLAVALAALGLAAVLAAALLAPVPSADRKVLVTTEPPGARVALVPLDPLELTPQFDKALQPADRTPVTLPHVPPGDYLVVAEVPGHGFHEVYRHVPERGEATTPGVEQAAPHRSSPERSGVIEVPVVRVPKLDVSEGMVLFPGGEFTMGSADFGPLLAPPHARTVGPFYLDKTEVTVARYRAVRKSIPRDLRGLAPEDEEPVRFVTFDQAVRCAEEMGKRLPDEAEYEFAATNAGKDRFPWGDDFDKTAEWKFGPVGSPAFDRALAHPAVCGLFSNVAEWTTSSLAPYPGVEHPPDARRLFQGQRIVRGGPWTVAQGTPRPRGKEVREYRDVRYRYGVDCNKELPGLGFRCARSLKPRFPPPTGTPKL